MRYFFPTANLSHTPSRPYVRWRNGMACATLLITIAGCQPIKVDSTQSTATLEETRLVANPQTTRQADSAQKLYKGGVRLLEAGKINQAVTLFKLAADEHSMAAHFALAQMYRRNEIPLQSDALDSETLMLFHLRIAADGGHAKAQTMLGLIYQQGHGLPRDIQQAIIYYTAAAKGGSIPAQYNLGLIHSDTQSPHYAPEKAATLWQQASAQGDMRAKARLGWLLFRGEGIAQDHRAAVVLWQEASRDNQPMAFWGLGHFMGSESLNAKPDFAVAAYFLGKALEAGIIETALPLAELYRTGKGIAASDAHARALYQQSLEQTNNPEAAYWLGMFAKDGRGGVRDLHLAERHLQSAYSAGFGQALIPLLEIQLAQGKKPKKLLRAYLLSAGTRDPAGLQQMMELMNHYKIDVAEYALPPSIFQKLNELIAASGDLGKQKELAQLAAQQGNRAQQRRWLEAAAASGDLDSRLALADLLAQDEPEQVFALEQELAFANNTIGLYRLGKRYAQGVQTPVDITSGFNLLYRAAKKGHLDAAFLAAKILQQDDTEGRFRPVLRELLTQAGDGGIAEANLMLARLTTEADQRNTLLLRASQQGSDVAALAYGEANYYHPDSTWQQIAPFYQQAADAGFPLAQLRLAQYTATHSEPDAAKVAFATIKELANHPDTTVRLAALTYLTRLYIHGDGKIGLSPDRKLALDTINEREGIAPNAGALDHAEIALQNGDLVAAIDHWQQSGSAWGVYQLALHSTDNTEKQRLLRQAALGGVAQAYGQVALDLSLAEREAFARAIAHHRQQNLAAGKSWAIIDAIMDAQDGISTTASPEDHAQYLQLGLRLGLPEAYAIQGKALFASAPQDPETAAILTRAVELGQVSAKVTLGRIVQSSNPAQARALWNAAAKAGNSQGKLFQAWALERGIGGAEEPEKAFSIYRELFESGDQSAGYNLANMYLAGRGTEKNVQRGLEIFEQAGNRGDPRAWLQLGKIFADPSISDIYDPTKSAGFLLLAAHSQQGEAWHLLGKLYDTDGELPTDLKLAYEYYAKAALLGIPDAQYRLGLGYRYGYGMLDEEYLTAYAWLEIAAKNGDIAASLMRDSILVDFQVGDKERALQKIVELESQIREN